MKFMTSLIHLTQLPGAGEEEVQTLGLEVCSHAQREAMIIDGELLCSYQKEDKVQNAFVESS